MTMRKTHLALLVALLLVDVTLQSEKKKRRSLACPDGWTEYHSISRCYLIEMVPMTALEAVGMCCLAHAHLAEPRSAQEMAAIVNEMRTRNTGPVWTGGLRVMAGDNWGWTTGDRIGSFRDWYPPNPSNTKGNEDCIEIRPAGGYRWNDVNCGVRNRYVCEIRLGIDNASVVSHIPWPFMR